MATESFFSNASLAYLASAGAGKDGKTYSIKPSDGTGDFTFSRGSNLTATRVGSNGLIEKGRENKFLQSNNFTTSWTASNLTVTSGEAGYDGTNDAWKFLPSGAPLTHFLYQNVTGGGVVTFSIYAKAAGYPGLFVYSDNSFAGKYFNVQNGTLGDDYGSPIDSSITAVGNGWYRCTVTVQHASGNFNIFVSPDGVNTYGMTADGTSAVLVQDAQMEGGLVATDYIESGASTGKAGLLENEPRFDYSGGATCPSLLLEPQRVQLVPQSEYITSSSGLATIEYNGGISPEGVSNAIRVIENTSTSFHTLNSSATISSTNSHTLSVFVKTDGVRNTINLRSGISTNIYTSSVFTLSGSGSYAGSDGGIKSYGNGWYRIHWTFSHTQTGTATLFFNASYYAGTGQEWFFYGAQLEEGSYPTSYIPNHSGGSVTRSIDIISKDLTSVINNNQMTMFVDVKSLTSITTVIAANNFGDLRWYHLPANTFRFYKMDDATWITNSFVVNEGDKIALTLTDTQAKLFVNGAQVGTTFTLTTSFQNFSNLNYNVGSSKNEWNQLLFFSTPLSDADCITLTT